MTPSFWTPDGEIPLQPDPASRLAQLGKVVYDVVNPDDPQRAEQDALARRQARYSMGRTASVTPSGASSITISGDRPSDPFFYWKREKFGDYETEEGLVNIRKYGKHLSLTNPVAAGCVEVYARFPLSGLEVSCKERVLADMYEDLFFDGLDYEDFLISCGWQYWSVGEAWPMGSFDEVLGVWEADELVPSNDIRVTPSPFYSEPRLEMRVPAQIRKIITTMEPLWEYRQLVEAYPSLAKLALLGESENAWIPVSNILMRPSLRFQPDPFFERGMPILMRAFRYYMQEDMLNAAVDSVAWRLYMPLLLAKIGASATDLGIETPWIPNQQELADFEALLDAAFSADFRTIVTHFATDLTNVFGREIVPRLNDDFDRITEKQLQAFGLSRTMLSGAGQGETYAADAINRDLVSQLLQTFQRRIQRFWHARAAVVAEAQAHYDYELKGGRRVPIMEQVKVRRPDGTIGIEEKPKLLVPELRIKAMNMQNEVTLRQLIEALHGTGVPISDGTRLQNIPIDLEEERRKKMDEEVADIVAHQQMRQRAYFKLRDEGLPIPRDLYEDFKDADPQGPPPENQIAAGDGPDQLTVPPMLGTDPLALPPGSENGDGSLSENGQNPSSGEEPMPTLTLLPQNRARPPESDEQRATMPKASLRVTGSDRQPLHVETTLIAPDGVMTPDDLAEGQVFIQATGLNIDEPDSPEFPAGGLHAPQWLGLRHGGPNPSGEDDERYVRDYDQDRKGAFEVERTSVWAGS